MYTFNLIKWCNWQSTNKLNGVIGRVQYIATNIFNFNNQIYKQVSKHMIYSITGTGMRLYEAKIICIWFSANHKIWIWLQGSVVDYTSS